MMPFTFTIADLVTLVTIVVGLAGIYWKISNRLSITEMKLERVEKDVVTNERRFSKEIQDHQTKTENKLDDISQKIERILIEIGKLQATK